MKWEKAQDNLCAKSHRLGIPKIVRGHMLSESLSGPAYRTVESSLDLDEINSEDGVSKIVQLLVKFNPATHAHGVFVKFKSLMQVRRFSKERFKNYVNRFDAAAAELRSLTGLATQGESEQFVTFQLLEGAHLPTTIFMQVLGSCTTTETKEDPITSTLPKVVDELLQAASDAQTHSGESFLSRLPAPDENTAALRGQAKETCIAELKDFGDKVASIVSKLDIKKSASHQVYSGIQGYGSVVISYKSAKTALIALDAVSQDVVPSSSPPSQGQPTFKPSFLAWQGSKPTGGSGSGRATDKRLTRNAQWISQQKSKTRCKACKQIGHWAGDKQCPVNANIGGGLYQGGNPPPEAKDDNGSQSQKKVHFKQPPSFFH